MTYRALVVVLLLTCLFPVRAETLRIGVVKGEQPYSELDADIQDTPLEPALLSLLAPRIESQGGTEDAFEVIPVASAAAKFDLLRHHVIDGFFIESATLFHADHTVASRPLFSTGWRLVSLNDRVSIPGAASSDLNHRRIIIVQDAPIQALKQRYPDITLIFTPSLSEAITLLKAGSADGVLCRQITAQVLAENLYRGQLQINRADSLTTETRLVIRDGDPSRLAALNQTISHLSEANLQDLLSRHFTLLTLNNVVPRIKHNHRLFDTAAVIMGVMALFLIAFLVTQIARRRQSERRLQDNVKFWQTLLNSLSTPVMVCDAAGLITHANPALCRELNVALAALVGSAVETLNRQYFAFPALDTGGLVQAGHKTEATFFEGSYLLQGRQHSITGWITPFTDTVKVTQGLVIGWYDMSERIALEARLAQALTLAESNSRQKGEFLARMSHEIRSPMNVIMGVLEMENQRTVSLNDSSPSPIALAYQASRGLLQIIGDVLDLSKIEAGEMQLMPQPVSLYSLLTTSAETYAIPAARKGLRLETDIESCYGKTYLLDAGKVTQILNNLLSNAVKYTQKGYISLSVVIESPPNPGSHEKNQEIIISIRDSGIGIDSTLLPHLLKPYRQLSSSTPNSSGLGLTICHQLVTLMGGRLSMTSTQGKGSDFGVIIPAKSLRVKPSSKMEPSVKDTGATYHLWIIDDLPANLRVMKQQLTALGHRVSAFDSATAALKYWQQHPALHVDLIFTDCQMPILDGYQFAAEIRLGEQQTRRHVPIIGCTANAFSDEEKKCLVAGMDGHLTKPIAQSDLGHCLLEMLQQRHVDLVEIMALSAAQPEIMAQLIAELQSSSRQDMKNVAVAWQEKDQQALKSHVHRLKGNFALAQFEAGLHLSEAIEQKIMHNQAVSQRQLLRLQHATLHFISLLIPFSEQDNPVGKL